MNDIELIIFDFDGVIVDSEYLYKKANIVALKQADIQIADHELDKRFWGMDYPSILENLRQEFGTARTDRFHEIIQPTAHKLFEEELEALPHVIDYVKQTQYDYCIASNSRQEIIKTKLEILDIYGLFSERYFGADIVAKPKPATDLFEHAADKLGAKYENCLVIEDGVHGITAAGRLGMTSIGYTGASHNIENHDELLTDAGAVHIFDDMRDLPQIIAGL
ncbi:MAG: HAD family phosphatase [Hyphomicrobiales bacterium]